MPCTFIHEFQNSVLMFWPHARIHSHIHMPELRGGERCGIYVILLCVVYLGMGNHVWGGGQWELDWAMGTLAAGARPDWAAGPGPRPTAFPSLSKFITRPVDGGSVQMPET